MDKKLVRILKDKELCEIYDDNDLSVFSCGYILDVSEDYVLLNCIDICGNYDGLVVIPIQGISKVELKTRYISDLLKLVSKDYKLPNCRFEQNPKITVLKFAKENGKFIRIELHNSGYDDNLGVVGNFDDNLLYLNGYESDRLKDGEAIIKIEDITKIKCDTRFEQKVSKLVELKK